MTAKNTRRCRAFLAWPLAFTASAALAQPSVTPTTPPASTSEDVIELSPFEVRQNTSRGYVASESLTGTRVATQIKDLPFSVAVMTSEFFDEFAFFELNENVAYISSFTGLDQGGGFNLRGFNASNQLRDGFFRLGRYGSSNVDRIEVIKGPSASIYGQTSPGGMLNMISKKPKKKTSFELSLNAGDYDTERVTAEATGMLGFLGDTYYITTLGHYNRSYETPMSELTNTEGYVAVQHDFKDRSSLLVQFEYFLREQDAPTSSAPFILDDKNTPAATDDQIVGIAKELGTIQQFGPESELNRGMVFLTGTYSKTFNNVLSARVSSNYFRARRWDLYQNVTAANVNQRTLKMQRGTAAPNKGIIFEDGGALQGDLLATFGSGPVKHRILATVDYNTYYRYDPNWSITGAALTQWNAMREVTVTPDLKSAAAPIQYLSGPFDWSNQVLGRKNKNRTTVAGTLLRYQLTALDENLIASIGGRFDRVAYSLRDLDATPAQNKFDFNELTPNAGLNYKITRNIAAFVNYSEGFFPNQQFITASSISPDYESERAQGYDYGFKGTYFEERLNFTLNGFRIERQNVVVQEFDFVTSSLVNRPEGDQLVQGLEIDVSWRVNNDFTVGGSYGYLDSKITDFGTKTMSVGRAPARISPANGGFYTRYEFSHGPLKGLSANVGVTYLAETTVSGPDAGDTYSTTGVFLRSTNEWNQRVPAATVANLGIRYRFKPSGAKLTHSVGLNANNLFDKFYLQPNRQVADRRSVFFNYTISY
jgi:iron complex outermembrane receptor protein